MTSREVRDKFTTLTRGILDGARAEAIWECVDRLETAPSVAPLAALLRSPRGGAA
jgi:hypothetical protein